MLKLTKNLNVAVKQKIKLPAANFGGFMCTKTVQEFSFTKGFQHGITPHLKDKYPNPSYHFLSSLLAPFKRIKFHSFLALGAISAF
jgi:hypothetical protein